MLPQQAKKVLAGWVEAAAPVVQKLNGETEMEWPEVRRQYMSGLSRLFPAVSGVVYQNSSLGEVPVLSVFPEEHISDTVVLYIHGGGYVHGGTEAYCGLAGRLARQLSATVYLPDYRQAPDFPFPVPLEDVFSVYRALISGGTEANKLVLVGDSAGGAMVVTMMRKARDADIPLPAAGVAFSPWANLTHSGKSGSVRDGLDPLCSTDFLNILARTFLAGELPTHPDASPVYANLHGLSPVMIQAGENEVMLSDAIRLAGNLAEARVRTTLEVWPEMFHVWHLFAGILPEADKALCNAVRFLEDALEQARG